MDSTFGKGEEVMEKLNAEDLHLGRFEYGAAFDMGYEFGQGVEDTIGGLFDFSAMDSLGAADGLDAFNLGNTLDGIYGNTGDTAGNTAAMSDALDIAEEDLAYLRDIAEREAINRFTTAEIHVEQHNENHISSDTDLDGIMDAWANDFAEKLDVSEEGCMSNGIQNVLGWCAYAHHPSKVKVKINNQNETLTLISGEEINILKARG